MEKLYKKDGFVYFRKDNGRFLKVKKNRFEHGEIVSTSDKHYSKEGITVVLEPKYTEKRGWVYREQYIDLQGSGGGTGWWNNEDLYTKISSPIVKIFAKRINLKREINALENELKNRKIDLEKIDFSLSESVVDFDKVERVCNKCGALFIRNSTNVNSELCDDCF